MKSREICLIHPGIHWKDECPICRKDEEEHREWVLNQEPVKKKVRK